VVASYQLICEHAKGIEKASNTLRHEMGVMYGKGPAKMGRGNGLEGVYTTMYLQRRVLSREETS
jgi:hypothetical protein